MTTDHTGGKPNRRDLMKPVQLLGLAFGAALFAGLITLVVMGFFQQHTGPELQQAVVVAAVAAGVSFIAVLVIVSLLLLAVDPAQVQRRVDRPVLLDAPDDIAPGDRPDSPASGDAPRP